MWKTHRCIRQFSLWKWRWAGLQRWSPFLHLSIPFGFCSLRPSVNFLVSTVDVHVFLLHTSEDVSSLSQHVKHQLGTCISTELFQSCLPTEFLFMSLWLITDFPCASQDIPCHNLSVAYFLWLHIHLWSRYEFIICISINLYFYSYMVYSV